MTVDPYGKLMFLPLGLVLPMQPTELCGKMVQKLNANPMDLSLQIIPTLAPKVSKYC